MRLFLYTLLCLCLVLSVCRSCILCSFTDLLFMIVLSEVMFGGDSGNPGFPFLLGDNQFQFDTSSLPQLQLFGDCEFEWEELMLIFLSWKYFARSTMSLKLLKFADWVFAQHFISLSGLSWLPYVICACLNSCYLADLLIGKFLSYCWDLDCWLVSGVIGYVNNASWIRISCSFPELDLSPCDIVLPVLLTD